MSSIARLFTSTRARADLGSLSVASATPGGSHAWPHRPKQVERGLGRIYPARRLIRICRVACLAGIGCLLIPGSASAATATVKMSDKGSLSRLTVTLDGFSDSGRMRIVRVAAYRKPYRFALSRSGRGWVSAHSKSVRYAYGSSIRLTVERANGKTWQRTVKVPERKKVIPPQPPVDVPPDPGPTPNPTPDPVPEPPPVTRTDISIPSLVPNWSPSITDFTVECSDPVVVTVEALPSEPFAIDGTPSRSGRFSKTVSLDPGQSFSIGGNTEQTVRCRPADMVLPTVTVDGAPESAFYMVGPTFGQAITDPYFAIFNRQGVPVWWFPQTQLGGADFKLINSGQVATWDGLLPAPGIGEGSYTLRNLDGTVAKTVSGVGHPADLHDLQPTSDGGWLTISYVGRDCPTVPSDCEDLSAWGQSSTSNVVDGIIQKQDADGNLVWTWNSRDHIAASESADWLSIPAGNFFTLTAPYDLIHLNSVEEDGSGIVFSARHLNAVYRISDPGGTGNVDWKLGGTPTPESLTPVDDSLAPSGLFGGQHDARILANGNLTVHDNRSTLSASASRTVEYRIDTSARTATLVNTLSDPDVTQSWCCGSSRKLAGGGWAVSWGNQGIVAEYAPDGTRVFELKYPAGSFTYRMVPVQAGELSAASLRAGMDSQFPR